MRRFLALLALAFASCAEPGPLPVVPVDDPPAPGPIDPGPVNPPKPTTNGVVTLAAFDAVLVGATEADTKAALGSPFRESDDAGFRVYVYALANSDSIAWIFFKDGKAVRKARL